MEPVRILQVVSVMNRGGVENMIMNFYHYMNHEKIKFDFIIHGEQEGFYDQQILAEGGKLYHVRTKSESFLGNLKDMRKVMKANDYKIVHVHQDAMSMFALREAKKAGVPVRVAHAHSTNMPPSFFGKWIYKYAVRNMTRYATHKFGCSKASANYLFNGDLDGVQYYYNGIDTAKFAFQPQIRAEQREKYQLGDSFVMGQVANFQHPKNQEHTLAVFSALLKEKPNSQLVFCGDGPDRAACEAKVREHGLQEKVLFLGSVQNVHELLQAFDVLILPSFYEGFPVALVEAQCGGLPCVVSDVITRETQLTGKVTYVSLQAPIAEWVQAVRKHEKETREDASQELVSLGFDIADIAHKLEDFYLHAN